MSSTLSFFASIILYQCSCQCSRAAENHSSYASLLMMERVLKLHLLHEKETPELCRTRRKRGFSFLFEQRYFCHFYYNSIKPSLSRAVKHFWGSDSLHNIYIGILHHNSQSVDCTFWNFGYNPKTYNIAGWLRSTCCIVENIFFHIMLRVQCAQSAHFALA